VEQISVDKYYRTNKWQIILYTTQGKIVITDSDARVKVKQVQGCGTFEDLYVLLGSPRGYIEDWYSGKTSTIPSLKISYIKFDFKTMSGVSNNTLLDNGEHRNGSIDIDLTWEHQNIRYDINLISSYVKLLPSRGARN
jgi:hypothetical protein